MVVRNAQHTPAIGFWSKSMFQTHLVLSVFLSALESSFPEEWCLETKTQAWPGNHYDVALLIKPFSRINSKLNPSSLECKSLKPQLQNNPLLRGLLRFSLLHGLSTFPNCQKGMYSILFNACPPLLSSPVGNEFHLHSVLSAPGLAANASSSALLF